MTRPSDEQVADIAAQGRDTSKLLATLGAIALERTAGWKPGPRSPNLQPNTHGSRTELVDLPDQAAVGAEVVTIPSDPTGEGILDIDHLGHRHDELIDAIQAWQRAGHDLRKKLRSAVPQSISIQQAIDTASSIAADGWCRSCWRDHQHLEPIAMKSDGHPRYRDYCRLCGEWKAEHQAEPPMLIIETAHRGQRITTAVVKLAITREDQEKLEAKTKRKAS